MKKLEDMFPLYHSECGSVLFYYIEKPIVGEIPVFEKSYWSDGNKVESACNIPCKKCEQFQVAPGSITVDKPENK